MPATDGPLTFEQPRSVFSTWIGIVLLFGFFALLVWAVMGAMPRGDDYEKKRAEARTEKLKAAREEWTKSAVGYGWVDKEKGVVRMPMARAMELELTDLAQKKPAPAYPIPPDANAGGAQQAAPIVPPAAAAAAPQPADKPKITSVAGKDSETHGGAAATANPPNAQPGTQPGPANTPSASMPPGADQPHPGVGLPTATPAQAPVGTSIPVPGKTP